MLPHETKVCMAMGLRWLIAFLWENIFLVSLIITWAGGRVGVYLGLTLMYFGRRELRETPLRIISYIKICTFICHHCIEDNEVIKKEQKILYNKISILLGIKDSVLLKCKRIKNISIYWVLVKYAVKFIIGKMKFLLCLHTLHRSFCMSYLPYKINQIK